MAHTMGAGWLREALPMPVSDAGADQEMIGSVAYLTVDITSYPTGGETITAGEVYMRKIYGAQIRRNELGAVANGEMPEVVVAADGLTMVIHAYQDDGTSGVPAESANTSNLGVCSLIVWGEGYGHQEN